MVVGMCYDSYKIILFTIILVPITVLLMLYPLLTLQKKKESTGVKEQPILDYPQADFNASIEPTVVKGMTW